MKTEQRQLSGYSVWLTYATEGSAFSLRLCENFKLQFSIWVPHFLFTSNSRLKLLAGGPNFPVFLQAYYERNHRFLTSML